jgi:hypothetical protein
MCIGLEHVIDAVAAALHDRRPRREVSGVTDAILPIVLND